MQNIDIKLKLNQFLGIRKWNKQSSYVSIKITTSVPFYLSPASSKMNYPVTSKKERREY
jgi:hypothetical protein